MTTSNVAGWLDEQGTAELRLRVYKAATWLLNKRGPSRHWCDKRFTDRERDDHERDL